MLLFASPALPLLFAAPVTDQPVPVCLFEAGEYKDRGVTITPGDLETVVSRFHANGAPVTVRTEHEGSPLDPLGEVVGVYHKAGKLYVRLCSRQALNSISKPAMPGSFRWVSRCMRTAALCWIMSL